MISSYSDQLRRYDELALIEDAERYLSQLAPHKHDRQGPQLMRELIRRLKAPVKPGVAGECERCGEDSMRLIGGACARCRDANGLE